MLTVLIPKLGDLILLFLDRLEVFVAHLFHHHGAHQAVVVFEYAQLSGGDVELVDKLAALLRNFSVDQLVNIIEELLTLASEVERLLLLHVKQVLVLVLADVLSFNPASELSLAVLEESLAEHLQALVKVLHGEYDSGSARQGFDLSAPVPQFGQERLHEAELVHHVQVAVVVHRLVQCGGKLLLGVDVGMHAVVRRPLLKCSQESGMLLLDHVHTDLYHFDV
mmetsp:Transcript_8153/g.12522  ORF Transcript_8153/g.12522 Transcript_8153/m.12522 type:complete len:223 (+) Transcript_8153:1048-1716(+)